MAALARPLSQPLDWTSAPWLRGINAPGSMQRKYTST
jgi:hypothetical protein